ncbi:MAG: taurine dioxygenase [Sphingomonas bacterium]|uniref:TauD/TfdA dioxygenase family protein n=1 Tax=Sphingomonas bacterium TaxID=1895847 RepID=UPI002639BF95|nr:TauD/TfdA family dioxygenase [Sphingomonas bacterium]MDB5711394.1 taurine dioxygenase [Sphingomonas bacterium]
MNAITALRPDTDRKRFAYGHITVDPVTPTIGAEISGIDLRQPITPEIAADIQKALHDWRVVFFRDQDISNDQLKAFGRAFGPLTPAHPISEGLEDHPEIWERTVDEYRTRRERNTSLPPGREPPRDYKGWHIDITFVANPNRYSILHGVEIPPYGGDTLFTNLIAAYEGLSAPIRTLIDGLQAVHRTTDYDGGNRGPRKDGRSTGPFVALHPLVRIHPETGEKLLFLNPGTISHIVGLKEPESKALLDLLFYEATRPEYQVRFHWRPKSLVVWDNQAVAHAGPIDYAQFDLPRAVRRITVAGELTRGAEGFVSRQLEGELFNVLG